jgi:hypothetical protein
MNRAKQASSGKLEGGSRTSACSLDDVDHLPGLDVAPFHDPYSVVLSVQDWASSLYLERPEGELLKPLPTRSLRGSFERPGREAPEEGLMALVGAD